MLAKQPASLGGFEFDAIIKRSETMTCDVPEYATEEGYSITDNICLKPRELEIEAIITNSPVTWAEQHAASSSRVETMVEELRQLWLKKTPVLFTAAGDRYITVVDVTSNILFESVEYGNYVQADKTIDQIVTSVDGWDPCINEIPPIKGRLTQKDSEARASYTNRVASRGTGTVNAIVSLLYSDVEGVTFAAGYQNDNDEKDAAGRPPHCIEIIVQGGLDEDVSDIIWKNKPGGIRAYGSHYAYATDINGIRQYVEFTRVKDVYLLLSVKVTSNDELDADFETRIKSLLMAENLLVGSPIRLQKFIRPIIENVSGVDYIEIRGILSEKQDIEDVEDGAMLTGAVPVSISQQPVVTMDGIRVVKA